MAQIPPAEHGLGLDTQPPLPIWGNVSVPGPHPVWLATRLDFEEQLEDLMGQHKDLWEFHVSYSKPRSPLWHQVHCVQVHLSAPHHHILWHQHYSFD